MRLLWFVLPLCLLAQGDALVEKADRAFQQGDLRVAESLYRRALELQPESADLHTSLANILAVQSRWTEAETEAETAIRFAPNDPAALTTMAKLEARFHRSADALALFRK